MNNELLETYKQEMESLLQKKLIRPTKSPRSCLASSSQSFTPYRR